MILDLLMQTNIKDILLPPLEWQSLTPEVVVLLFALLAPIVGIWDPNRRGMQQFALIGLIGSFIIVLGSLLGTKIGIPGTSVSFNVAYIGSDLGSYAVTEASQIFKLIFLATAILAVIGIGRPLKGNVEQDWGEFVSLLMFATLGMMIVASAQDLIVLLLGIETASMSSYLLAAFARDKRGAEASLKYFVIGAISSGMSLFAISLLYAATGTTRIAALASGLGIADFDLLVGASSVLLLAGIGFKISTVPFHAWAPDVYHGAPAPVAGVLAAASKAMGFAALFTVFLVGLGQAKGSWELAVAILAVASMFFGNLVALRQQSVTRMLAYSSIAQAGYLLIALAVGTWFAVGGGILHLFVNAAMKLGAFLVIGALLSVGLGDTLHSFKGLGKRAPLLAFAMTVFLLSMAGLPPLGGFASKFVLFSSAVDVGVVDQLGWLVWLAVFAVVNSAISLYYYVRVMRVMYIDEGDSDKPIAVSGGIRFAVTTCLLAIVVIGVYPQPFVDAAMSAARSLLAVG